MANILKKFIRNPETRNPRGVIVGTEQGVGWSLCGPRDVYDPALGLKIALSRASYTGVKRSGKEKKITVPPEIAQDVQAMEERRLKYFKPKA